MTMYVASLLIMALVPGYLAQEAMTCGNNAFTVAFPPPLALPALEEGERSLDASMMYVIYEEGGSVSPNEEESCRSSIVDAVCGSYQKCAEEARTQLESGGVEDLERVKRLLGMTEARGTKALELPAADHNRVYVNFARNAEHTELAEFVFYHASSLYPSALFFCQAHFVRFHTDVYELNDMYACRNVILADVKKKREKEEGGGEEEAVGRLLHSKLRMQWYAEAGLLTKKGPTPKEPHCFEGTVSIGCLFYKHNTDKGFYHGYYRTYATLLEEYREKERVNLLEIGVKDGESMNSWIEYFEGEGSRFFGLGYGEGVGGKNVLDIIIDDGSHDPSDQMVSFEYLFPRLKEGGLYIFEDIETSYWNNNRANLYGNYFGGHTLGVGGANNVVEKFLKVPNFGKLINGLFVKENRKKGEEEGRPPHSDMISSVQFCHNMIVVKKMDATDEWVDFKNSPYLFERFTE
ncbi:hypothetical protein TrRE_jg6735 [Triparma retinervis]|uniref:O-methyltransferase n=1 Tax=Triparma retinervis TaxID=2557542 RepID=A0A9W6ZS56_9STRA|nr:hypothetical protein TrRE_jg6735 [Triparma retinervis]